MLGAAGTAVTCTWNVTVLAAPCTIVPRSTPACGSAPGCTTPSMRRLFATKVVPAGGASVKSTLVASAVPAALSSTTV